MLVRGSRVGAESTGYLTLKNPYRDAEIAASSPWSSPSPSQIGTQRRPPSHVARSIGVPTSAGFPSGISIRTNPSSNR